MASPSPGQFMELTRITICDEKVHEENGRNI